MDIDSSTLSSLILLLILIGINAFFTLCETAVIGLNDARLCRRAEEGDPVAGRLHRLTQTPSRFLSALRVGSLFSAMLAAVLSALRFTAPLTAALGPIGLSPALLQTAAILLLTLLLAGLILLLGELLPKRIAAKHAEAIAYRVAAPLAFLTALFRPAAALLSLLADLLARLFGVRPGEEEEPITEEEIRMLVDVGEENGSIEETEREMINNIFEFDDRMAVEVMTHRTDMFAVEDHITLDGLLEMAIRSGHSRIPVYQGSVDDIVGILYVKDLLPLLQLNDRSGFDIRTLMRKPLYVPESTRCDDLFRRFTANRLHMAVVVDEYGGTAGIVTMEDLVESILGNIQDEYDHEEEDARQLSEDLFLLDGSLTIDEAAHLLDIQLTDESDYETIGGLLVEQLDHIPAPGQHPEVVLSGFRFRVEESDERRIIRIAAHRLPKEEADE